MRRNNKTTPMEKCNGSELIEEERTSAATSVTKSVMQNKEKIRRDKDEAELLEAQNTTPRKSETDSISQLDQTTKEDEEKFLKLQHDSYTMMFLAEHHSYAYVYGLAVCVLQVGTSYWAAISLQNADDYDLFEIQRLGTDVIIFQVLALVTAFVTIDDIPMTISNFKVAEEGFAVLSDNDDFIKNATYSKWRKINILKFCCVMFVNFANFLFIVKSDSILNVLLNFAAIHFISDWDDIAFRLATRGLVSDSLHDEVIKMQDVKIRHKKTNVLPWFKLIIFVVVVLELSLFTMLHTDAAYSRPIKQFLTGTTDDSFVKEEPCWTVQVHIGSAMYTLPHEANLTEELVTYERSHGFTLDETFNSVMPPDLHYSLFSGEYIADKENFKGDYPIYYERGLRDALSGIFFYCENVEAWVFTVQGLARADGNILPDRTKELCGDDFGWLLKSPKTTEQSLDDIPSEGWTAWTGKHAASSDIDMTIKCLECESDDDCGLSEGHCDLETKKCVCGELSVIGPFCNIKKPCHDLVHFDGASNDISSESFSLLENVMVYDRPVFVWEAKKNSRYEVILFAGTRWHHTTMGSDDLVKIAAEPTRFHGYWGNFLEKYKIISYSEETDAFVPIGPLQWFRLQLTYPAHFSRMAVRDDQRFACLDIDCAQLDICGQHGRCIADTQREILGPSSGSKIVLADSNITFSIVHDSKCDCSDGYSGPFCERPPSLPRCNDLVRFTPEQPSTTVGPFSILENLTASYRPLFYWNDKENSKHQVVVHSGERWLHASIEDRSFDGFMDSLHTNSGIYDSVLQFTMYYSEGTDAYDPVGPLQWFQVRKDNNFTFDDSVEVDQRFECLSIECTKPDACGVRGECFDNAVLANHGVLIPNNDFYSCDGRSLQYASNQFICGGRCYCNSGYTGHTCEHEE